MFKKLTTAIAKTVASVFIYADKLAQSTNFWTRVAGISIAFVTMLFAAVCFSLSIVLLVDLLIVVTGVIGATASLVSSLLIFILLIAMGIAYMIEPDEDK